MGTTTVREIVARVQSLPALSPAVLATLSVLDNPESTARDVARAILADPVMTGQILRLANSACYGRARRVTTVSDATTLLGFQAIRSLLMTVAMRPVLSKDVPGYGLQQGEMWQHSIAVAACSQEVALRSGYRPAEEAFVAGLIHDIGKVALGYAMADRFQRVLERAATGEVDFLRAEREEFGVAHDDVGAMVARLWGLPDALGEVVSYHHRWGPDKEHARLTAVVHVADVVCLVMGIGLGADGLNYQSDGRAMAFLGMSSEDVECLMKHMASRPIAELWRSPVSASPEAEGTPPPGRRGVDPFAGGRPGERHDYRT